MEDNKLKWHKTAAAKYALYGALFGLFFPLGATYIDIIRLDLEYSLKSVIYVQQQYPIHFIIDTAPFFLGLFSFLGGVNLDKIKEKNALLKKSAQFKDQFLASMSHEIRTPMSGIIGMVDILAHTTRLDDVQKEYVGIIQQSSQDLLSILNDILDLSKLEAGEMDVLLGEVVLENTINKVLGLFLAKAKQKNISVESDYASNIPRLLITDGNKLTQVLSNLVSNAIKFTDTGNIWIRTSLLQRQENQCKIKIEVIDSGSGISFEGQKKLFKKFKQLDEGSAKRSKGTGLGLSICKKLVELLGGEIGVESNLGKGSNFWFTFNAVETKEEIKEEEIKDEIAETTANYDYSVLIVDDIDTNIFIAKTILQKLGCQTEEADCGKQAIEKFERGKFDLVLMDIQMPGMDGVETTRLIRSRCVNPPPIIALSANAMEGDAEKYITQGFDDYIAKPITAELMIKRLNLLNKKNRT